MYDLPQVSFWEKLWENVLPKNKGGGGTELYKKRNACMAHDTTWLSYIHYFTLFMHYSDMSSMY